MFPTSSATLDAHLPSILASLPPERRHEVLAAVNYQRTREMTIDELLLENRVVFLIGEINHASAARVMMQMLYLENQKRGQDINFYINSPGGSVDDTLAVYDTMQFISSDVATFCIGRAYSGGAVLLASGQSGKRHILPHAKVMIHQPYGGVTGQTVLVAGGAGAVGHYAVQMAVQLGAARVIASVSTLLRGLDSPSIAPFGMAR